MRSSIAFYEIDLNTGLILHVSKSLSQAIGYAKSELEGHDVREFMTPHSRERFTKRMETMKENHNILTDLVQYSVILKSGKTVDVVIEPSYGFENGKPVKAIVSVYRKDEL